MQSHGPPLRIAIIGSGISGLVVATTLHRHHDVTLFESENRLGGHTNTVTFNDGAREIAIDTGFIVFNDWTYPNFIALLDELGVESTETSMSFSVQCQHCGLEYNGANLNTLYCQRRNLLRPTFHRLVMDILKFNRIGLSDEGKVDLEETVDTFLQRHHFSDGFARHYLLPMGAAIWSCPMETFRRFPIQFILEFYRNHGLLNIRNRPTWRTIAGGAKTYVDQLVEPFSNRTRLGAEVTSVKRTNSSVTVRANGEEETFDEVVFACHSDQALKVLADPSQTESDLLATFPYGKNQAILHTDASVLPERRSAWASWNYFVPRQSETRPCVTYNMNILQHLATHQTVCVTLNSTSPIDPDKIAGEFDYAHPVFTTRRAEAQRRHAELIRSRRTSYCGAYWGNGFHEDGVVSALRVCEAFGIRPAWSRLKAGDPSGRMSEAAT